MNTPFVTLEEVASHFAVSTSTARNWLRQGHIPKDTYIKLGSTYRFNLPAVEAALMHMPKQLELDFETEAQTESN